MIKIEEKIPLRCSGLTSLFITFKYDKNIVDVIKNLDGSLYHKKEVIWETPIINLSNLIDSLCEIDSIELNLLKERDKKNTQFEIGPFKTTLLPHQVVGVQYGLNHNKFLLLDCPGLGKSLQIIDIASELKKRNLIEHCLIICGINALKSNWKKEVEKHSDLSCRILGERITRSGTIRTASIEERLKELQSPIEEFFVVTNIETLREDKVIKELNNAKINKFDMVAVDEIHKCGLSAAQSKNLLKLKYPKYRIGATGTLLLNSPLDSYIPLKFIEVEKSTLTNFKYFYCSFGGEFHNIPIGFKHINMLKDEIDKVSLRRKKDELELPPKTVIKEYVEMDDKQSQFYDNIKKGIVEEVDKVKISTASLLALTARLRQATILPSILTTENINSAKIDRAVSLAKEIIDTGEKVVIFSTFKDPVYELAKRLSKYNPSINTGDIKDNIISKNIDSFQNDPNSKVFIGTYAKCATGITLNSATYMICLDQCWTAAQDLQAQDRIYRIGTKNSVTIYDLITRNTIDERVDEIVQDKEAISDYIVDNTITQKGLESLRKYIEELK